MRPLATATALACLAALAASPAFAQDAYDAAGWKADAAQVREAMTTRYANLEWAQTVREADLGAAFDSATQRLDSVKSDREARELFDGLAKTLADGHVKFDWPAATTNPAPGASGLPAPCARLIIRKVKVGAPAAAGLRDYQPLATPQSAIFPAGLLTVDGRRVGVIRIAQFSADIAPQVCEEALARLAPDGICDEACNGRLYDEVHGQLTRDFGEQLRALKAAGAQVLMVDVTGNRGGSGWSEALVRMVSGKRLVSTQVRFVRGEHWTKSFDDDIARLEALLAEAKGPDRTLLKDLLAQVRARRAEAATPCDGMPFLTGRTPACDFLGKGFYSSGMLASGDPKILAGKDWAGVVFNPMYYPYEEGVWSGPLIVAVDENTASSAEQFVAVLQDNRAAIVVGSPTKGAGCGYTWGGTPVTLKHSGAILRLPDCARFRTDGTNEVVGISPDVLTGYHVGEGPRARAARLLAVLPEAVRRTDR